MVASSMGFCGLSVNLK